MKIALLIIAGFALVLPLTSQAQDTGLASGIGGLQAVLDQIYTDMLQHSGQLIGSPIETGYRRFW